MFPLSNVARALHAASERELDGPRLADVAALAVLADLGWLSQAALGERIGVDRTTVIGLTHALEDDGLIASRTDPEDRRRRLVGLTTPGSAALEDAGRVLHSVERRFISRLSAGDSDQLRRLAIRVQPPRRLGPGGLLPR